MNKRLPVVFLFLFAILALLPVVQQFFKPFKLAGLQGAFVSGTMPSFSFQKWTEGRFQTAVDYYLKHNMAFNGELVRLRNQIDYELFGNINTNLVLGAGNFIFDPSYAMALAGDDLITDSVKQIKSEAIRNAVYFLNTHQIPVLVIFAPNKAGFYKNHYPHEIVFSQNTNKAFFTRLLNESRIAMIDMGPVFEAFRDTVSFAVVPRYGAHWSVYGAALVSDTIIKSAEAITGMNMRNPSISHLDVSNSARFTDDDYLPSLNMMRKWPSGVLAYPAMQFSEGTRPDVLIISDSFIWNFYDLEVIQNCFGADSEVWYYMKSKFDVNRNRTGDMMETFAHRDIIGKDLVIILTSDPGLTDFGYGFFEAAALLNDEK